MKTAEINIPVTEGINLKGNLTSPDNPNALIIFSHGSGSSRFSPRNRHVAEILNQAGFATLLTDLLTEEEDDIYENRFNIDLITERLVAVTNYVMQIWDLSDLPIGYFGASTGAASALKAAAILHTTIKAVVSRGGRPDLAGTSLSRVTAPTLLIVGSLDVPVIELNEQAYSALNCTKRIQIVTGATHLYEEHGKLEEVAELATDWFSEHLIFSSQSNVVI
jgi:putative phosphoribosyl transferase